MYAVWENPPYKGGWLEIYPTRRRGMNQNTTNPGLALRCPIHRSLPIEWDEEIFPRITLNHGGTGHPGLAAGRNRGGSSHSLWRHFSYSQKRTHENSSRRDWRPTDSRWTQNETSWNLHGSANSTSHTTWINHGCM